MTTATQLPLTLPRGEYQPPLFPSLPARAPVPPVRGLGVGQGSGGPFAVMVWQGAETHTGHSNAPYHCHNDSRHAPYYSLEGSN